MEGLEVGIGYDITQWFNGFGEGIFSSFLGIFNFIGSEIFYVLLFALIFWCINKSIGKRILILALLTGYVNILLKNLWMRPRPYNISVSGKDSIINRLNELDEYSFPSEHVMGVTSVWLFLASYTKKISAKLVCFLIIMLASISRLVHGVNFIQDVIVGFVLSLILLLLFKVFEPKVTTTCNQKYTIWQRIFLIIFSSVTAFIVLIFSGIENVLQPIIIIGSFLGATIGIVLEKEYLGFDVEGSIILRVGRYFLGIIIISLVYSAVEVLFTIFSIDNIFIVFLKFCLLGFVITYPIPKLFVMMNLATNKNTLSL